jgi:hypothetical protein
MHDMYPLAAIITSLSLMVNDKGGPVRTKTSIGVPSFSQSASTGCLAAVQIFLADGPVWICISWLDACPRLE